MKRFTLSFLFFILAHPTFANDPTRGEQEELTTGRHTTPPVGVPQRLSVSKSTAGGQHRTGLIHRLYADVDWSLEAGLYGFGSAYSIYLPRSARGPNFPVNQEPEPMPADLLIPLEISDTQLRIDPVGQLHADDIMLTRTGSSAGIKYTDLVGYSPIAVKVRTLLWQHRTNRRFIEWKFNSSLVYQFSNSLYEESNAVLELTYQLDINRDGRIG